MKIIAFKKIALDQKQEFLLHSAIAKLSQETQKSYISIKSRSGVYIVFLQDDMMLYLTVTETRPSEHTLVGSLGSRELLPSLRPADYILIETKLGIVSEEEKLQLKNLVFPKPEWR